MNKKGTKIHGVKCGGDDGRRWKQVQREIVTLSDPSLVDVRP